MSGTNRRRRSQEQARRAQAREGEPIDLEAPDIALARATMSRLIPSRSRIEDRADEARKLEDWRTTPSPPDEESSIVLDDRHGMPETIRKHLTDDAPIFAHTLFPAMAAAENLTTVVSIVDQWDGTGHLRTLSVVSLLRGAFESSARTVWVLSPESRDERRARAQRVIKSEAKAQRKYATERLKLSTDPPALRSRIEQMRDSADALVKVFDALSVKDSKNYEQMIDESAKWIDANAPNRPRTAMADYSRTLYSIASGLTHGSQWSTYSLRGPSDLMNLVADALYGALTMTEGAICLYEGQAASPNGLGDGCPPHLPRACRLLARQIPRRQLSRPTNADQKLGRGFGTCLWFGGFVPNGRESRPSDEEH